jgi:hypothetical protein
MPDAWRFYDLAPASPSSDQVRPASENVRVLVLARFRSSSSSVRARES